VAGDRLAPNGATRESSLGAGLAKLNGGTPTMSSGGELRSAAEADGAAGARWGREGAAQSAKRADDGRNEPYGLGLADE
jgi:X-X-X-Leu-X-X-Gly heptad repeat protein